MMSEKRAQKFHTNDTSVRTSGECFWLVDAIFPRGTTNQEQYPDLGGEPLFISKSDVQEVQSDQNQLFRWKTAVYIKIICLGGAQFLKSAI